MYFDGEFIESYHSAFFLSSFPRLKKHRGANGLASDNKQEAHFVQRMGCTRKNIKHARRSSLTQHSSVTPTLKLNKVDTEVFRFIIERIMETCHATPLNHMTIQKLMEYLEFTEQHEHEVTWVLRGVLTICARGI